MRDPAPTPARPRLYRVRRVGLAGASAFVAVNIWTGAPVLALWIGSLVAGQTTLSMRATIVVVAVLTTLVLGLATTLAWLNDAYRKLVQAPGGERRSRWLRPVSDETGKALEQESDITVVERIVMICVYVAVALFVAWFLFFARSPLPH